MCFVDFVADSLVSCMVMIDGGSFVIKSCKHGIAVLSEEAFHVMAYVSRLVSGIGSDVGDGVGIGGLGCVYSFMGSLYLKASVMSCFGRYGNASCRFCMLSESGCKWM
jgi:hypothetical protein